MIVKTVKKMMLNLCTELIWREHLENVVKCSLILADKTGADKEICEISAWLHDITKIKEIPKKHHVTGAKEARKILEKLNYPEERIKQVEHCIISHSSDENYIPKSIEAKIVASADALSHFVNPLPITYFRYGLKQESYEEGKKKIIQKYKNSMKKIFVKEAQEIANERFEKIKDVFNF